MAELFPWSITSPRDTTGRRGRGEASRMYPLWGRPWLILSRVRSQSCPFTSTTWTPFFRANRARMPSRSPFWRSSLLWI